VRVDRDRDGDFSADEKAAYVSEIMASVTMSIDGTPIEVPSPAAEFPDAARLRTGDGAIRLSSTIAVAGIGEGAHAVSIRNDYRPESSVYLANALAPDGDLIAITRQTRDPLQRELTIDYTIGGKRFATLPLWLFGSGAVGWVLFRTRRPA
jgi:hypothetical protein